nr:hypothetical protein [candidate division Zixibacteria bacterium]
MSIFKIYPVIICLITLLAFPTVSPADETEIQSYDMFIKYLPETGKLELEVIMELIKSPGSDDIKFIFNTQAVTADIQTMVEGEWIGVPNKIDRQGNLFIGIHPDQTGLNRIKFKFLYSYLIGAIEEKFVLYREHRWYPQLEGQLARARLVIEVPQKYMAISGGRLAEQSTQENGTKYVWESGLPVFKIPLLIARDNNFHRNSEKYGGGEIVLYCQMNHRDEAGNILVEAADAMEFYDDAIGHLPYDRLTLVEISDLNGTDINSGLIFMGPQNMEAYGQGSYESLLFPIAALWIGAGAFPEYMSPGFFFLLISVPHHLRLMFTHSMDGVEQFEQSLNFAIEQYRPIAESRNDLALYDIKSPDTAEKGFILYGKGPYVLDLIRRELGDENYWAFIRDVFDNYLGKTFTLEDFLERLSHYGDGSQGERLRILLHEKGLPE